MDDKTLKRWASGPLCTIAQAAALLGVSSQTVRRMVLHGHLIAWRPNPAGQKRLLYRRQVEDLAAHSQSRAIRQARLMQDTFDFLSQMQQMRQTCQMQQRAAENGLRCPHEQHSISC